MMRKDRGILMIGQSKKRCGTSYTGLRVVTLSVACVLGALILPALASSAGAPNPDMHFISANTGITADSLPSGPSGAHMTPPCGLEWRVVTSPNVASQPNTLRAVAAASTDDVWAVGYTGTLFGASQALSMRWNGTSWAIVPTSGLGTGYSKLFGVAVAGPSDVWAVGSIDSELLIIRWNGTSWTRVSGPSGVTGTSRLLGVTAISPGNVWAAGNVDGNTLILRWNGTQWSRVP